MSDFIVYPFSSCCSECFLVFPVQKSGDFFVFLLLYSTESFKEDIFCFGFHLKYKNNLKGIYNA